MPSASHQREELGDGMGVRGAGVFVPDVRGEEFEEPLGGVVAEGGDHRGDGEAVALGRSEDAALSNRGLGHRSRGLCVLVGIDRSPGHVIRSGQSVAV